MRDTKLVRHIWRLSPAVRRSLPAIFERIAADYQRDANPRHVWEAYQLARDANVAVPDWVLAYLDRVAESMADLNLHPPSERQIASAATRALELPRGGRRNPFRDWPKQNHEEMIVHDVQDLLDDGHKLYEAARTVGLQHPTPICRALFPHCRKPLSRAAVERYYKASTAQKV